MQPALVGAIGLVFLLGLGGLGACGGDDSTSATTSDGGPTVDGGGADGSSDGSASALEACKGGGGGPGERTVDVVANGTTRKVSVHVPPGYDGKTPTMLVLDFHGNLSSGAQEDSIDRMNAASDKDGFVSVHPDGTQNSWNGGSCCGAAKSTNVDDVAFVRAMIDAIAKTTCIDPKHVHAAGLSNGGMLSYRLACEASDRIASIASVAGPLGLDKSACNPSRPIAVLHVHGTKDPVAPYDGGPAPADPSVVFSGTKDTMAHFRSKNACTDAEHVSFQKGDATCATTSACAGGSEVTLCTIDGGGHTWPGGVPLPEQFFGKTSTDLDATAAIVAFFRAHPMP